jgi:hypothetical protein
MTAACRSQVRAFAVAFAVLGCIAGATTGKDNKPVVITPEAEKAILAEFPNAKIGDVETRREGGFQLFEVELTAEKEAVDVTVSAAGVILGIEVEIAQTDVPKPAADAIARLAAGARVTSYGRLKTLAEIERGKIVKDDEPFISYTADLVKGAGKDSLAADVEVSAEGKVFQRPTWKKAVSEPDETKQESPAQSEK